MVSFRDSSILPRSIASFHLFEMPETRHPSRASVDVTTVLGRNDPAKVCRRIRRYFEFLAYREAIALRNIFHSALFNLFRKSLPPSLPLTSMSSADWTGQRARGDLRPPTYTKASICAFIAKH